MKKVSKFELISYFFSQMPCVLFGTGGMHAGTISSIQHEDGSGSSFNITMTNGDVFHLRTID